MASVKADSRMEEIVELFLSFLETRIEHEQVLKQQNSRTHCKKKISSFKKRHSCPCCSTLRTSPRTPCSPSLCGTTSSSGTAGGRCSRYLSSESIGKVAAKIPFLAIALKCEKVPFIFETFNWLGRRENICEV